MSGTVLAADDPAVAPPGALPDPAAPDTVRTNLWLTEALMGEIVTTAAASLPPGPHAVKLVDEGGTEGDALFGGEAANILREQGHQLFVAAQDSTLIPPVDYIFGFKVIGVDLSYPEVGRTLGIWQRWVARDLSVSVSVEISAANSGQLLFKDIPERRFSDRVDNSDFDLVGNDLYEFTDAQMAGSGWQNRMEEIVVLGTLVALIAIYFANTGS
jgi:hypothetical protein